MIDKQENTQNNTNFNSPFRGLGGIFFIFLFLPNFIFAQFNLRFAVQQYDHALYNKLINRTIADNSNIIQTQTGTWEVKRIG